MKIVIIAGKESQGSHKYRSGQSPGSANEYVVRGSEAV